MKHPIKHQMNKYRINKSHKCYHTPICIDCMTEPEIDRDERGVATKVICKCGDKLRGKP
jgi:predicted ribosome-associated RNA-binding protein Tma20